jgi:mandelate racemase
MTNTHAGGTTPTLRSVRARAVVVPLRRPVIAGIGRFDQWPMVLVDVETSDGVVGSGYIAPYRAAALPAIVAEIHDLAEVWRGEPIAPADAFADFGKALNVVGIAGVSMIARSALDMALWDALAKTAGLPLVRMLGGTLGSVRTYNSNGLWRHDIATLSQEAADLRDEGGFTAMKLRLGHPRLQDDLAAIRAVRDGVGAEVDLMVDFNQALGYGDAVRRCHELDEQGLYWLEEPIGYDNVEGYAQLAARVRTPLQWGENYYGPRDLFTFVKAGSVPYAMADLMRIGGVTGWLQVAGLAAAAGTQLSSHLYPEISAHLLRVTPTAHWLEWVDWASPILAEPMQPVEGRITVPDRPGTGVSWDETAVKKYQVSARPAAGAGGRLPAAGGAPCQTPVCAATDPSLSASWTHHAGNGGYPAPQRETTWITWSPVRPRSQRHAMGGEQARQLAPVRDTQLVEHAVEMGSHRVRRQHQTSGDLRVLQADRSHAHDLPLLRREVRQERRHIGLRSAAGRPQLAGDLLGQRDCAQLRQQPVCHGQQFACLAQTALAAQACAVPEVEQGPVVGPGFRSEPVACPQKVAFRLVGLTRQRLGVVQHRPLTRRGICSQRGAQQGDARGGFMCPPGPLCGVREKDDRIRGLDRVQRVPAAAEEAAKVMVGALEVPQGSGECRPGTQDEGVRGPVLGEIQRGQVLQQRFGLGAGTAQSHQSRTDGAEFGSRSSMCLDDRQFVALAGDAGSHPPLPGVDECRHVGETEVAEQPTGLVGVDLPQGQREPLHRDLWTVVVTCHHPLGDQPLSRVPWVGAGSQSGGSAAGSTLSQS